MANEYTQHLEEEIDDLEGENTLLSLEVERLQEKFDLLSEELRGTLSEEIKGTLYQKLLRLANRVGIERVKGITKDEDFTGSEIDLQIDAYVMAIEARIQDLKRLAEKPVTGVSGKEYVRFMISPGRQPVPRADTYYDYDRYGNKRPPGPPDRFRDMYMNNYEEQAQYYQLSIAELVEDHKGALKALNWFIKRLVRESKDYSGRYDHRETEERIREDIAKQYNIRLLEHIKD